MTNFIKIKKLDLYISRKFLGTFIYSIILINFIVIIFDISERIDDFIQTSAPFKEIAFKYYLNFIPYFVNLFSPLFTFISVIFFTSRMANRNEIVAMLSSGISFYRILIPYLFSSILIALLSFYLANFVIPHSNAIRYEFEKKYLKNVSRYSDLYIHFQIQPGLYVSVESFNNYFLSGYRFNMEKIEDYRLTHKLSSEVITYDTITKTWRLENYFIRKINGLQESLYKGTSVDTILNINPEDLTTKKKNIDIMNWNELNSFIEKEKLRGSQNINYYLVEKYKRMVFPFATVILTLIGVSLSSRKLKGGIGMHIGIGITISFAFILFMQVSTTFSLNANLPPELSVWIPNLIFGVLSIFLLKNAPK